jgi:hypothetical protein
MKPPYHRQRIAKAQRAKASRIRAIPLHSIGSAELDTQIKYQAINLSDHQP